MIEKYLYFRKGTAANTEVDDVTGSNYYPFSAFLGACSGTATILGAITDDDNAVSLFFTPKASTQQGGDADDAEGDNVDVVVLATAQYGQKAVVDELLKQMVHVANDKNEAILTVFDGYSGSEQNLTGITDITVLCVESAD
tara:strand:+ start:43 stop:465 length:423 start_codon:yes stop_codon:yes gene_type:complete